MLDQSLTVEDVLARQNAITGAAGNVKDMPRRCTHGVTTNQRCDACNHDHTRWYQMEIPDKTTTLLVRYVLTDQGVQSFMTQPGRAQTAWFPGYLEIVDFRPIWATWRDRFARAIVTMDNDHGEKLGLTADSFDQDDLMEAWSRDILPHRAAMDQLARFG